MCADTCWAERLHTASIHHVNAPVEDLLALPILNSWWSPGLSPDDDPRPLELEPDNRAGQRGGGEDQGVLDLSHQLVSDLLTEELCAVQLAAVLRVDVELPDQLQQLVHGAVGRAGERQLGQRGAPPGAAE